MRPVGLVRIALAALAASIAALAQDTSNGNTQSPSPTQAGSSSAQQQATPAPSGSQTAAASGGGGSTAGFSVVTTTITSVNANPSTTETATFVLTLTLANNANASAIASQSLANVTMSATATTTANETTATNGTSVANSTIPWNDTMSTLPFTPRLDAAYGVGGALLILTGVPVAALGGRNRWSALAIVSGYTAGLLCLVFILSFGVTPAMSPPSPEPPTASMRGLYLLATVISTLIGAGLGVFWYTFARYWVGACGGFSFGWFLLALHKGGLVTGISARWGIIGGLTVLALLGTLVPVLHEPVLLAASAWVGATAFTLGVDCYTRAGLKEFYIYNLGYSTIFPSLNGGKFPLTQNMQVELGVIAAVAIIAAAVQFKVLGMLKERRKKHLEEEEARIEAEHIHRAAENFKNVDAELVEWEGKHGTVDSPPPNEGMLTRGGLVPSTYTLVGSGSCGSGHKEMLTGDSPPRDKAVSPAPRRMSLLEEMGYPDDEPNSPADAELEQKLMLLAEVRRARQSVRSSMDALRSSPAETPSTSRPGTALERARSDSGGTNTNLLQHSRHNSATSARLFDRARNEDNGMRRNSNSSIMLLDDRIRRDSLGSRQLIAAETAAADTNKPRSEWDEYVASRRIVTAPPAQPIAPRFSVVSDGVSRAVAERASRSVSMVSRIGEPTPTAGEEYGRQLARTLSSENMSLSPPPANRRNNSTSDAAHVNRTSRAMTTDELGDRHREMMARMQDKVSGPYKEELALEAAKQEWEKRKREERERQAHIPRSERGDTARGPTVADLDTVRNASTDRSRLTEWRHSVQPTPVKSPRPVPRASLHEDRRRTSNVGDGERTRRTSAVEPDGARRTSAADPDRPRRSSAMDPDRPRRTSMNERPSANVHASPRVGGGAELPGSSSRPSRRPSSGFIA